MSRIANKAAKIVKVARLHRQGVTLKVIASQMGIDHETARYLLRCEEPLGAKLAHPVGAVPQRTLGGVLWQWPPLKPRRFGNQDDGVCEACALIAQCNTHVHSGDFIGCEWPIDREMIAPGIGAL